MLEFFNCVVGIIDFVVMLSCELQVFVKSWLTFRFLNLVTAVRTLAAFIYGNILPEVIKLLSQTNPEYLTTSNIQYSGFNNLEEFFFVGRRWRKLIDNYVHRILLDSFIKGPTEAIIKYQNDIKDIEIYNGASFEKLKMKYEAFI